jgi:NADH-quinone oxidoreductase subunit I
LDSHTEEVTQEGSRRPTKAAVLDDFRIDYGLCMYCGICIEVCPFDALEWSGDFDYATEDRSGLVQDAATLEQWRQT